MATKRMMVYGWEDMTAPGDIKHGEHFNEFRTIDEANADVIKYIRESLGRQKYKFDEGNITIHYIFDASVVAKKYKKFYNNAKFDDLIRERAALPGRVNSTSEFHRVRDIPAFIGRVRSWLDAEGQSRPTASLSFAQIQQAHRIIDSYNTGNRVIVGEYCPRFGKTMFALVTARELNIPLTVVSSYVLTSFTSFYNECIKYEQFKNFVLVDTGIDGWQQQVKDGLAENKQVVAFVSLCKGPNRDSRFAYLRKLSAKRFWVVDEADYGAHKKNQCNILQEYSRNELVLLMTGSGGDRAASTWTVDAYFSVTYPELLLYKRQPMPKKVPRLKYFDYDHRRDQSYPDLVYIQLGFGPFVNQILKYCPELSVNDLPSFTKMIADPVRSKGFITTLFGAVFSGKRIPQLTIDRFIPDRQTPNVGMVFLPANAQIKKLDQFATIVKEALPSYQILTLHGGTTTNKKAEGKARAAVQEAVDKNKNLLIIAAQIAQRSFSLPEIVETYLMYDNGAAAPTMQKASRTLTPNGTLKIGTVISLSFDPNRDDKFDALIDQTITNVAKNLNISLPAAAKLVFDTGEFFEAVNGNRVRVTVERYLEQLMSGSRIGRVIGRIPSIDNLLPEIRHALLDSQLKPKQVAKQPTSLRGNTYVPTATSQPSQKSFNKNENTKIREAMCAIYEHCPVFFHGTLATTVDDMLDALKTNATFQKDVKVLINVDWVVVHYLLNRPDVRKRLDWFLTVGQ